MRLLAAAGVFSLRDEMTTINLSLAVARVINKLMVTEALTRMRSVQKGIYMDGVETDEETTTINSAATFI